MGIYKTLAPPDSDLGLDSVTRVTQKSAQSLITTSTVEANTA